MYYFLISANINFAKYFFFNFTLGSFQFESKSHLFCFSHNENLDFLYTEAFIFNLLIYIAFEIKAANENKILERIDHI